MHLSRTGVIRPSCLPAWLIKSIILQSPIRFGSGRVVGKLRDESCAGTHEFSRKWYRIPVPCAS